MSRFLERAADAPWASVDQIVGDRPICVLAPHPDDETLGCGAIIHDAAKRGLSAHIVCVTDGSASHPASVTWPPERIAMQRRQEFLSACRLLDPGARVDWLGHGDCKAPRDPETAAELAPQIAPNALMLCTWDGDPHVDHQSCAMLARHIDRLRDDIQLLFYPIWGRFTDGHAQVSRIHASPGAKEIKRQALSCHASQMTPLIADDPTGFVMSQEHQQHFLAHPEMIIAA